MNPEPDDDDDHQQFPVLFWIPALYWILHGAIILGGGMILFLMPRGGIGNQVSCCEFVPLSMIGAFSVHCGLGIVRGRPFALPVVLWLSFLGFFFVPLVGYTISPVFVACESAMFLLSGAIAYYYEDAWFAWVATKPRQDAESTDESGA